MKSFLGWVRYRGPVVVTYTVLLTIVGILFTFQSNSLIPGYNDYEAVTVERIEGYLYPWRNPVDAPYIGLSWLVSQTGISPLTSARLVSAVSAVGAVLMFYQLLRNWLLSPGKALVGTALFASSSWLLIIGRGAHQVTFGIFLLLLLFELGTRLLFTTRPFFDWLLISITAGLALYTPNLSWLLFVAGLVSLIHYRKRQRGTPIKYWQKCVVGATTVIVVLPLIVGLIITPGYAQELLGVEEVIYSIPTIALHIAETLRAIFFVGSPDSPLGLGRMPALDIFSVFMFMLGCYHFERRLALKRSKMLFGGLAIGLLVCSLSGFDPVKVGLLIPLVYIFVAAGLDESITRWLVVFPKNPIARAVGVIVISVAVGFVGSYHLRKTFIARPQNPEIRVLYAQE
jgi:hypothetical protein